MKLYEVEARRWLQEAENDLRVVRTLVRGRHYAAACFYSQQAAEKALKALLYDRRVRPPFTHSVAELLRQCAALVPSLGSMEAEASLLDQYYIPTRYPDALPAPAVPSQRYTSQQARAARRSAERIVAAVRSALGVSG
ncbi:hypothetical protein HRbin11_00496 [bacterium HR11]|nr:hypothetical protein HRbin11_00496 [bacterium HR11]